MRQVNRFMCVEQQPLEPATTYKAPSVDTAKSALESALIYLVPDPSTFQSHLRNRVGERGVLVEQEISF